jgi:hypothetical protein
MMRNRLYISLEAGHMAKFGKAEGKADGGHVT